MPFLVSLRHTFKRALSKRYFLWLYIALQFFSCEILINRFQIRKVHAIRSSLVIFSSPQLISPPQNFFDEKTFFRSNFLKNFLRLKSLSLKKFFKKNERKKFFFHRKNFWEEIWVVDLKIWLHRMELHELYESKNRLSISYTKKVVEPRKVRGNNAWKVFFWRSVVNLPRMASYKNDLQKDFYNWLCVFWGKIEFQFSAHILSTFFYHVKISEVKEDL